MKQELVDRLNALCEALNVEIVADYVRQGFNPDVHIDRAHWKERSKYCAIDIGGSGAWLVDKTNGEIFNIKGYGTADLSKKRKADIGNVYTVEPARMLRLRYNYLR